MNTDKSNPEKAVSGRAIVASEIATALTEVSRLHPAAEALLDASNEVRASKIIQDHTVLYSALLQIIAEAEWMVREPRQTRARGRIICADRSNGKTSIADLIHQRFHDYERSDSPCVMRISMSGLSDARSVYGRIMEELGSPARISHRLSDRVRIPVRLNIDSGER